MKWGYKSQLDALELLLTQLTRTNLLDLAEFAPETAQVGRTEIYVYHPDGIGRNQAPRVRQPTPRGPQHDPELEHDDEAPRACLIVRPRPSSDERRRSRPLSTT
jgi:hypothetical protein